MQPFTHLRRTPSGSKAQKYVVKIIAIHTYTYVSTIAATGQSAMPQSGQHGNSNNTNSNNK